MILVNKTIECVGVSICAKQIALDKIRVYPYSSSVFLPIPTKLWDIVVFIADEINGIRTII